MTRKERLRETISAPPTLEYISERLAAGWKMSAIEWQRDVPVENAAPADAANEEIPYGLQVSDDCSRLVHNPSERQIVIAALDMIVDDRPLSQVADELNRLGFSQRDGQPWTPTALFVLLPRMIEIGPRLFTSADWATRKQRLKRVV